MRHNFLIKFFKNYFFISLHERKKTNFILLHEGKKTRKKHNFIMQKKKKPKEIRKKFCYDK
jgi:hypothetical protein